uniref:Uncharacterized protein n=1 Tax=Knipowitschia caucasica TaxID=637954 RepID=A0AAV2JFA1_KNICA
MPRLNEELNFNFQGLVPSPPPSPESLSPSPWCAPIENDVFLSDAAVALPEPEAMVVTAPEAMDFVREFNKLLEEEYQPGALPEPEACHENEAPQGFEVMDFTFLSFKRRM